MENCWYALVFFFFLVDISGLSFPFGEVISDCLISKILFWFVDFSQIKLKGFY